jgi:hypothetical protein
MKAPTGTRLSLLAASALLTWAGQAAASPARLLDAAGGQALAGKSPATPLDGLGRDGGARFGDWVIWRYDGADQAIFVIHQKTRWVFYMPWVSNGWANYRTPSGDWYVLFSKGPAERQDRSDLPIAKYLDRPIPGSDVAPGDYRFRKWTVKVTDDQIHMTGADYDDKIIIRKDGTFAHNGRESGEKAAAPVKEPPEPKKEPEPKPEPKKEAAKSTLRLDAVANGEAVRYGDWIIRRTDAGGDDAVFFIHEKTRRTIYMPWTSNGWINYRDAKAAWFVVFSTGAPEPQNRDDLKLGMYLDRKPPAEELVRDSYKMKQWTVRVDAGQIEMVGIDFNDRIIIPRNGHVFTHNGRKIGE